MKTLTSLLFLAAGMAFAQNPDSFRRPDYPGHDRGPRVEGAYESFQRDRTVHRILRLGRDGGVEMVTEFRRKNDRDSREGWIRMERDDVERYGRLAEAAARGRTIRQSGRWTLREGRIVVDFGDRDDLGGLRGRARTDMEFAVRGDNLVYDRNSELYGRDKITFKPDDGWTGGGPRAPRGLGFILYDRDYLRIEGIDLREGRDPKLVVRAEGRRLEFPGEIRRRGDEVTFRIPYQGRDGGEFRLTMRGDQVVEIHGAGAYERHRIDFDKEGRRS